MKKIDLTDWAVIMLPLVAILTAIVLCSLTGVWVFLPTAMMAVAISYVLFDCYIDSTYT